MNKKLMLFFSSLMIFPVLSMENNEWQPWVKEAKQVQVKSMKTNDKYEIDDNTTIKDLKEKIFDWDNVPTQQQKLRAHGSYWLGFGSVYSDPLSNDSNVKAIMNKHNTALFALTLTLREQSEN